MSEETTPKPPPQTAGVGASVETEEGNSPEPSNRGQKFSSDSPSMDEIRRRKKPNRRSCHILLDSSLAHEIWELEEQIEKLKGRAKGGSQSLADNTQNQISQLEEQLHELEDKAEEETVEFIFQDVGRKRYDQLIRDNQPSEEEKQEYKEAGGDGVLAYSFNTFPQKLVAEASYQPQISEEQAEEIFAEWGEGDLQLLFNTALLACKEPTSFPKSRAGTAMTLDSPENLTSALNGESPTQSS